MAKAQQNPLVKFGQTMMLAALIYAGIANPSAVLALDSISDLKISDNLTILQPQPMEIDGFFGRQPVTTDGDGYQVRFYGPQIPPTISEVLLDICQLRGYGQDCAQTLLGMIWKESKFEATAKGDGGRAHGYFQIHYRLHKITLACAQDLRCSANWTIDYLESNGYPSHPMWAIQCHNGCGVQNGYANSVQRQGKRLWPSAMVGRDLALK